MRESDAVCIWLALPLVIQLFEWSVHRTGHPRGLADVYAVILGITIAALALVWARLKIEYQGLIRRERSRAS